MFELNVVFSNMTLFGFGLTDRAAAQDEDGYYNTSNDCVGFYAQWESEDVFESQFTNYCEDRIYIRFRNETYDGEDCSADGLSYGETKYWDAWIPNSGATGQYAAWWVGSLDSGKDWVRSGKVSGWRDDMF